MTIAKHCCTIEIRVSMSASSSKINDFCSTQQMRGVTRTSFKHPVQPRKLKKIIYIFYMYIVCMYLVYVYTSIRVRRTNKGWWTTYLLISITSLIFCLRRKGAVSLYNVIALAFFKYGRSMIASSGLSVSLQVATVSIEISEFERNSVEVLRAIHAVQRCMCGEVSYAHGRRNVCSLPKIYGHQFVRAEVLRWVLTKLIFALSDTIY